MSQLHPLREYRKANGLTLVNLAEAVGSSKATICKIETGAREPNLHLAVRLSEMTGIPVKKFIGADGQ